MKVKVLKPCYDNKTYAKYTPGAVIELPQDRAEKAIESGLVAKVTEEKAKVEKTEKATTKKAKSKKG